MITKERSSEAGTSAGNSHFSNDSVRSSVREHYGKVARAGSGCGCSPGCCSPSSTLDPAAAKTIAEGLGYSPADAAAAPEGANLGLGCGNPLAIASLLPGETVLDLGSGAGFDAFLASKAVGPTGHVIGVDMTPDMVARARENAQKAGCRNIDFRLGEIEHLPVANGSIDVIISNCVVNLAPDKPAVFRDAFRVLKPGGRLCISDVVAIQPLPKSVREDLAACSGCVGGAALVTDLKQALSDAGFRDINVTVKPESAAFIREWFPGSHFDEYVASATITGVKPAQ